MSDRLIARSLLARAREMTTSRIRARALTRRRDGLVGVYFTPRHTGARRAALVMLGGSDGSAPLQVAARMAADGYPALALWYFGAPGLPRTLGNVPLEYFARALGWVARQPGVDSRKVVVEGGSRGGEAALLIASTYPRLAHGAIGLVPNYQTGFGTDGASGWTYRRNHVRPDQVIRVERINGPVLTAGAKDDPVWSSAVYVDQIGLRLDDHHFRFPHTELVYAHGGHAVGTKPELRRKIVRFMKHL